MTTFKKKKAFVQNNVNQKNELPLIPKKSCHFKLKKRPT